MPAAQFYQFAPPSDEMDRLTAFVTIAHAKLRIQIIEKYNLLDGATDMATPKLQGLAEAMKKLEFGLEDGAGKLLAKIETVGERGLKAINKGNTKVDGQSALVAEIEGFVNALEGANGGDPLDDSSDSSVKPPADTKEPLDQTLTIGLATDKPETKAEPAASWSASK